MKKSKILNSSLAIFFTMSLLTSCSSTPTQPASASLSSSIKSLSDTEAVSTDTSELDSLLGETTSTETTADRSIDLPESSDSDPDVDDLDSSSTSTDTSSSDLDFGDDLDLDLDLDAPETTIPSTNFGSDSSSNDSSADEEPKESKFKAIIGKVKDFFGGLKDKLKK